MAEFDPDALELSKADILYLINAIKDHWSQNRRANWVIIQGITVFKYGIMAVPEGQLTAIWGAALKVMNRILQQNALKRMRGEFPKAREMIDSALADLKKEGF